MSDSAHQTVVEKLLPRLKTITATDENIRWFAGHAFSRGLISNDLQKAIIEVGPTAATKADKVWDALLNRMKTGDSENTFLSIVEILKKEVSMKYITESLENELRAELHSKNEGGKPVTMGWTNEKAYLTAPYSFPELVRSLHHDTEANIIDAGSTSVRKFLHDERGIQEEQSSASAQLVTPQEAQTYDNFDRAIEQIKLAQLSAAAKDEEMMILRCQYEEKCKEVKQLTSELENTQKEKEKLCERINQLETEAREYRTKVDNLEDEVGGLKNRLKVLEESIRDKEIEKERLLKEKAEMNIMLLKKELELKQSEVDKERLKTDAAENQRRIAVFQAQEEVKEVEIRKQAEIESLQRRFSEQSLSKEEELTTLRQRSTEKDIEIESLRNELLVLKSQSS